MRPEDVNVLLGCEESQAVCIEFRRLGFNAFSCDLEPCSGGYPQWHLQMDVFEAIKLIKPKLGIFFPPCTYLTVTQNRWLDDQPQPKSGALVGEARREARREAIKFFIALAESEIEYTALENPIGCMSTEYRKPDQIIQPYYFGDESRKTTCLWLKNLPHLYHNKAPNLFDQNVTHVSEGESLEWIGKDGKTKRQPKWYALAKQGKDLGVRSKERSKFFKGISEAMATQWGKYIVEKAA